MGLGDHMGRGIEGWGKVTRSGLLGTPDLETFDIERKRAVRLIQPAARCRFRVASTIARLARLRLDRHRAVALSLRCDHDVARRRAEGDRG